MYRSIVFERLSSCEVSLPTICNGYLGLGSAFRSNFEPLTRVCTIILAIWKPRGAQDLCNNHHDMFFIDICNRFEMALHLLNRNLDALVYVVLEEKHYFRKFLTLPCRRLGSQGGMRILLHWLPIFRKTWISKAFATKSILQLHPSM